MLFACAGIAVLGFQPPAAAQDEPFAPGWQVQNAASQLRFQSVKNVTKVESSTFAAFSGDIAPDGTLSLHVFLDSVDTKVDLRNVRMRFLFFETFRFPEAVITAKIDPSQLADLATVRRKTLALPYTLDLHGFKKDLETEVAVTMLQDDTVVVSSTVPIVIAAADFGLSEGITKLQEAANVVIIPSGTISFDLTLKRNGAAAETVPAPVAEPATAAQETSGDFDVEACEGRFEILSRSGNIYFHSGSARLQASSAALLDSVADIVARCPGLTIEVSGHTDADGPESANQRLSEARAQSVVAYLTAEGLHADRFLAVGYGESKPAFSNDNAEDKARNRRIEFTLAKK